MSDRSITAPRFSRGAGPGAASRPVLITGGAGFVGCNVAASFLADGVAVRVLDDLSRPGVEKNLRWLQSRFPAVEFRRADVRDAAAVNEAVRGCSRVYHFAAQVAVTTSLTAPLNDFDINARGTLNVLEAVRAEQNCGRDIPLLFTSTNKVYGDLGGIETLLGGEPSRNGDGEADRYRPADRRLAADGVNESRPLDFHSPYGCSKGCADQYVLDYARTYRLPATVFRMSCIYGPHQFGTEDQGWVAHFARAALRGEGVTFYGDGRQVRDVLHVSDLVRAMRAALDDPRRTAGRAFNVGGGPANAVSLRQVVAALGETVGAPVEVTDGPWRTGDQRWYVSDTARLRSALGWSPRMSWRDGLADLVGWLAEHVEPQSAVPSAGAAGVAGVREPQAALAAT
ncbi:NAD-dependent epimerase/dehydratase family protein [Alienimonas californiensis]|uniref:CDP-paratose 2-epimerase n=1 Tax=Alienimonas californiensis TaxID=2527989 RepID=A0A517P5Q4_9PLAN|nr:NAD-dependent epimerase/dehydratase family protein [Alienimonas californiensis]QDT14696.1 CDP-paratose 2-epimerase [Alienimonas californiensis]